MSTETLEAVLRAIGYVAAGYFLGYLVAHVSHIRALNAGARKRQAELQALTDTIKNHKPQVRHE